MIDVDSYDNTYQIPPPESPTELTTLCQGYRLDFPDGSSPHTSYPFGLHATVLLPWCYLVRNGQMILFATACTGHLPKGLTSCQACKNLSKNKSLEGILTRIKDGVHENANFQYHGFGGLIELLRRKNVRIEAHRLRGLNQATKLLGTAAALSDYKRFMTAIASGKVERVDRVIRVGVAHNRGIQGIMEMFEAAAEGVYHPKNYTERDELRALLLWRLSGTRVAQINHRARGDPSLTKLRSLSFTPPITPSPGQPTVAEIARNVKATFEGVLNVIHDRVKLLHTVVMFDELATEKRIRWDQKTNHFLGVCREHAHKTSLEFVNEGDMEELFRAIDNDEVHYAKEVRSKFGSIWNAVDTHLHRQQLQRSAFSLMSTAFILLALSLSQETARESRARSIHVSFKM